jgi:hypothetical protein
MIFGIADEEQVHPDLAPNPDNDDIYDDDVDALDMIAAVELCDVFLYSADHEADINLRPGGIYQEGITTPIIRAITHLGLPRGIDIDAFELAWLPTGSGDLALALLFSVDDDDLRTRGTDESGGLDPGTVYGSFLDGAYFEVFDPVIDDGLYASTHDDKFLSLNKTSGAATLLGLLPEATPGLASTSTGRLFAVPDVGILIEINPNNPALVVATKPLDIPTSVEGLSFNSKDELFTVLPQGLTFCGIDRATNPAVVDVIGNIDYYDGWIMGLAFHSDRLWGVSISNDLLELNPKTGAVVSCTPINTGPYTNECFSLAFDRTGRLFMAGENLVEIVNYTSSPTISGIGATGYTTIQGLAFREWRLDDIDAITVSENDMFDPSKPVFYKE